jgi:hypothetical protein
MASKNLLLRIGLVWRNPTKIQMLKLSNTVFVGRENLAENVVYIGNECEAPIYRSDDWQKNMQVIYDLSIYDWEGVKRINNIKESVPSTSDEPGRSH